MKNQPDGTFNTMRKFKIREISAVPAGAMGEGSNMAIIKSAIEKKAAMTDPMDGHSHTLQLDHGNGELSSGQTDYNHDHSHPWIIGLEGQIVLGAANQHTHRVGFLSKNVVADVNDETQITPEQLSASSAGKNPADPTPKDSNMEPTEAELKLQEQIDALTKSLETSSKMAELSDAEKAYLKNLEGDEAKSDFLADENRGEIVTKAAEADPVVGEFEGREIRKSDDPTGVIAALIEKAKKDKKKLDFLQEKGEKKDLEKRAEELTHLSGDLATKVAMLKGIDSIEDEGTRKLALESLGSANMAKSADFEVVGTDGDLDLEKGSAESELDILAKAAQAADPSLSYEQAYLKVALTDEGQVLYTKTLEA